MNILQVFAILLIFNAKAPTDSNPQEGAMPARQASLSISSRPLSLVCSEAEFGEWSVPISLELANNHLHPQEQRDQLDLLAERLKLANQGLDVCAATEADRLEKIFDKLVCLKNTELLLMHAFPEAKIDPLAHQLYRNLINSLLSVALSLSSNQSGECPGVAGYTFSDASRFIEPGLDEDRGDDLEPTHHAGKFQMEEFQRAQVIAHLQKKIQFLSAASDERVKRVDEIASNLIVLRDAESRLLALCANPPLPNYQSCENLRANLLCTALSSPLTETVDLDGQIRTAIEREIEEIERAQPSRGERMRSRAGRVMTDIQREEVAPRSAEIADLAKEIEIFEAQINANILEAEARGTLARLE
jgi:hypothetical protein